MRRAMTTVAMVLALGLLGAQGACGQQVDLTPLQNQIADIQKQVQDLSSRVEKLSMMGGEGGGKMADRMMAMDTKPLEEKISALEKKVSKLEKDLKALSTKVDRVEKAVKSLAR